MKKILLYVLLCFFLHRVEAQDTLYIIGQTHIVDGPSFFDSSYQRELIASQREVKKILSSYQFKLIGDEGLSKTKGKSVYTLEEYSHMPIYERRYRAVPWMLYEGTLPKESVVGIEDPDIHQRMLLTTDEEEYKKLDKERSEVIFTNFFNIMKMQGITKGGLVVGSSRINYIRTLAKQQGIEVYTYCTSAHPEKYL